jgi:ornithine carbamoyltransferase
MQHFLDINKIAPDQLRGILDEASRIKIARQGLSKGTKDLEKVLTGKMVALIFEKPSTRTRISFDLGVRQMGGETMVLSGSELQLGHGETIADTARVLSRYVDLIMIRTFEEATLLEMADHATVPVINGLTNRTHPCQIMADILTFEEHSGPIRGKRVVWTGDGNNVCASFIHAAGQFGFDFIFTGPQTLEPEPEFMNEAKSKGVRVEIIRNPIEAVTGADLVITDTWISMHDSQTARERRHNQLRGYQVNDSLMKHAKPDAIFMHCLPAHRNEEVTSSVMDGLQSVVFDEAENRLHAQKAVMRWCLSQ